MHIEGLFLKQYKILFSKLREALTIFFALGYFTALFVTFIAMLYTFGVRKWLKMVIGSLLLAFIFQWLFMGIMLLNDPKGALVDMRPFTNWITGAQ